MNTQKKDAEAFLSDFKQKMSVFDVVFLRARAENLKTVLELELTNLTVRKHLTELVVEDYYKGPTKDNDGGSDLWEFGKQIKGKEVYIKIRIGNLNKPVICVSFHFPLRPIKYPFK